jgi:hypothetical protein
VITVAAHAKGRPAVEEWIKAAAAPSHRSQLAQQMTVAQLHDVRNVPATFWIDESGRIVRANDPVYVLRRNPETGESTRNDEYLGALPDWVAIGPGAATFKRRRPWRRGAGR